MSGRGRLAAAVVLFWGGPAAAATLTVDPASSGAYATVGEALLDAASGDTISLAAGTHTACIAPSGKSLRFEGAGAGTTTLSAPSTCETMITVTSGETLTLADLTLSNTHGRAIYSYYSTVELDAVEATGNGSASLSGGVVYLYGGSLGATGSEFTENTGDQGGAIYAYAYSAITIDASTFQGNDASSGGAVFAYWDNDLTITDSTFEENAATNGSGGALHVQWESSLALQDTRIADNTATGSGAGLYTYATAGPIDIVDSTLTGNTASGSGGGLHVDYYADLSIQGSELSHNTAAYSGGGLSFWYYGNLEIIDSVIQANTSTADSGGGVFFYPGDSSAYTLSIQGSSFTDNTAAANAGGLWAGWVGTIDIRDSAFSGNQAADTGTGGGVYVYVAGTTLLSGNTLCANQAGYGGGASLQWITTDVANGNLVVENTAASDGGGIYRYVSYAAQANQNTFVGNRAGGYGGAYHGYWAYSDMTNNLVAHSRDGHGIYALDSYSAGYSTVAYGGWVDNAEAHGAGYFYIVDGADGNVVADDAGFVEWSEDGDCTNDNLRLRGDSVLRDAGDPSIRDVDGSTSDVGAYGGPDAPVEDHDGDGFTNATDCDDTDANTHPDGVEVCDGVDNDCDGQADGADATDASTWYADADGDGWGDDDATQTACEAPSGTVAAGGDCDDSDSAAHPDAEDLPGDGIDQDCDGADAQAQGDSGVDGDSGEDDPGASDDGTPAEGDPQDDTTGCGCASPAGAPGGLGLALLAVVALARRRAD